jgi:hydrogenase-4 component E
MNILSGLLILSCLFLLGSNRLLVSVRMMAFQGMVLGLLPFIPQGGVPDPGAWFIGATGFILKGIILPVFLGQVLSRSSIRREIEPFVGYSLSIIVGIGLLGLSCWVSLTLAAAGPRVDILLLTAAFTLLFVGLFLIVSRRKAITQALGYLVMENGVYAASLGFGRELHDLVELGILLDVFVGVFLMGILLFHINREFDHIDADRFTELRDLDPLEAEKGGDER